ncbi:MAG: hypothetical protein AB1428_03125 [Bacteroidota bacterium]
MNRRPLLAALTVVTLLTAAVTAEAQVRQGAEPEDTSRQSAPEKIAAADNGPLLNLWGLDVLISTGGFGLGTFYRREFSADLYGFASFSVSEAKDEREFEIYDPYFQVSYVPGKLNRFLVLPLMVGVQYRLFREDIMDSFRPYINAAAGPTMIYMMPFVELTPNADGSVSGRQVEFFRSIGKGSPHYTAAAYVGFGANFGTDKTNVFGVNFRYYFAYVFNDGLPSLYDPGTGRVSAQKKDFGGFFITLNVGMGY